jgi:hypothetical protein
VFFVVSVVLPGLLRLRIAVSQNSLPGVLEEFFHSFSVSLFSFYFVTSTVQDILKNYSHWAWWLTPVILATQEAKIRRIVVRSQARQIVPETLS